MEEETSKKEGTVEPAKTTTEQETEEKSKAAEVADTNAEQVGTSTDQPTETNTDKPLETNTDQPTETNTDEPTDTIVNEPAENNVAQPAGTSEDQAAETISEQPAEPSVDQAAETNAEKPADQAAETNVEPSVDKAAETPADKVAETNVEQPAAASDEQSAENETNAPVETNADQPQENNNQTETAPTNAEEPVISTKEPPAESEQPQLIAPLPSGVGTDDISTEKQTDDAPTVTTGGAETLEEKQTEGGQDQQSQPETAETQQEKEATATVKFQLLPSTEVITIASALSTSISTLKENALKEIEDTKSELQIRCNGEEVNLQSTLLDLGVNPNGTIQFEILSTDPNISLKSVKGKKAPGTPDFITVRVAKENNEFREVVVEIERQQRKKTFLGGFRHKLSGTQFHHAAAQTAQKKVKASEVEKFTRDCQTVFEKNSTQQTTNVTSTQMPKVGCYISTDEDIILTPRKYITYDEYMKKRIKAVIVLQSYFRRWQARHLVDELKLDRDRRIEWERQEEIRKRREKEERIKQEFEKRINPKTREDFDLLYSALEKWRLEELGHIDNEFTGAERKAALCALLEQETQLIGSIDRRKIDAYKDGKEKKILQFLDKAAAPKRWKAYDGRHTEMDTQYTIRAKELRDIYNSINMKYLTQDERLDVLLTLKHTVKEHDCKLTREITELIDREADLLMRGVRDTNLEGLRKRISTLFLQYCKNPLFNPEAARLLKVPQDPSTLVRDIYFCPSSNQYLPSTEFQLTSKSRAVGKSRKVQQLDNEARTRQDYSHYRIMLRALRQSEEGYHDNSKIAYLIQEKDLQYLIENIWGAQSILSSWDDLYDLVLVRWDRDEEWSPWNTILLTKDEAIAHNKLDHLQEAYSRQFVSKVCHKHTLARVHFVKLPGMAEALRKKASGSQRLPGPGKVEGISALSAY
ncbi:IQ motif and ubiquitin-like domain-containing protein [Styela clava]